MNVTIRTIAPSDVSRVWELLQGLAAYEKLTVTGNVSMLSETLFGAGDRLQGLVAQQGERLVGYALYYPVFGSFRTRWRLWLEDLYVEPEARGTGAGAGLMAELARITLEGGYYSLDWEVIDWNRMALDFYERLGAHPVATDWLRYRLDGDALTTMATKAARVSGR